MSVPAPPTSQEHEPTSPVVEVSYEGPGPQRRLTVAFRFILALPHFVYAVLVVIAAVFAVIAAWFAALVLGRMPGGLADFLARVVQYVARVNAYAYLLLTDRYPPFDLGAVDDAVSVEVPRGVRLNRAAVLFRIILLIPAGFVVQFIGNGLIVVAVVAWLLTLMMGRLPVPLFEAFAAALRYEVRFYAYAALLTSEYPRGLFGDRPSAPLSPYEPPPYAADAVPSWPADGDELAPPPLPRPDVVPSPPRIRTLRLSRAAKAILVTALVLGVVFTIVANIVAAVFSESETAERLEDSYRVVSAESQDYVLETQRCAVSGGIPCLRVANAAFADAVRDFRSELRALEFNDLSIDDAEQLDRTTTALISVLDRMAAVEIPGHYDALLVEFQSLVVAFDEDFEELLDTVELQF